MSDIEKVNKVEAHRRAELIRVGMVAYSQTLETIAEAFTARDWVTLGYGSWDEYVEKEFAEKRLKLDADRRREAAEALRLTGMSTRAIGAALGVSDGTVRNDLRSGAQNYAPAETVTGSDGKAYAATKPAKAVEDVNAPADAPVTTDQPADLPAEAAEPAPVAAGGVVGAAPSAPSPLEKYLAADPDLPHREWRKNFLAAISKSFHVSRFTPEQVAEHADRFLVDELRGMVTNLDDYANRAEKAWNERNGGLRVLKGGAA